MFCQSCSAQLSEGASFCSVCGSQVASQNQGTWKCGNCEADVSREAYHCPHCGDSYELSVEYLTNHPEVHPYEADFTKDQSTLGKIFEKIFIYGFLGIILVMIIMLFNYLMF